MIHSMNSIDLEYPVLVLADVHVPFQNTGFLRQLREAIKELGGVSSVFYAGDTFDFYSFSNYTDEMGVKNISKEIKKTFKEFHDLTYSFEVSDCALILGNHERRIVNWSNSTIKAVEFLDIFLEDSVKIIPYDNACINNKWHVFHPNTCRQPLGHANTQREKYPDQHILIAHQHRWACSYDKSGKYHLIDLPTAADISQFEYVKNTTRYGFPNIGAVVLYDDWRFIYLDERVL